MFIEIKNVFENVDPKEYEGMTEEILGVVGKEADDSDDE